MDMSKLTPAPWHVTGEKWDRHVAHEGDRFPLLKPENQEIPECTAALEFAAIARNAFDILMRRRWFPCPRVLTGGWVVDDGEGGWLYRRADHGGDGSVIHAADPFTALVNADKWYKENVERPAETAP